MWALVSQPFPISLLSIFFGTACNMTPNGFIYKLDDRHVTENTYETCFQRGSSGRDPACLIAPDAARAAAAAGGRSGHGRGTGQADCNVAGSGLQTSSSLGECATHLAHGGRTRAPMCGATRAAEGGGALAFGLPGLLDGAARGAGSFCGRSKT